MKNIWSLSDKFPIAYVKTVLFNYDDIHKSYFQLDLFESDATMHRSNKTKNDLISIRSDQETLTV